MSHAVVRTKTQSGLVTYTRGGGEKLEGAYEKPVVLPAADNSDPAVHAWADARFATDIMAEHALFFALLMPPEVAAKERAEALRFSEIFLTMHNHLDTSPPPERTDLKRFANNVAEQIKPFTEYKAKLGDAQRSGQLRSLVWPLFFDHTQHEAERWTARLEKLAAGESEYDRSEVTTFWTNIMDEHARFIAHLLDPDEYELIEQAMSASRVFGGLHKGSLGGGAAADGVGAAGNPETNEVLIAAETILDFKTKATRGIEAARIKSIIDPRLANHVCREARKFVDELQRAV